MNAQFNMATIRRIREMAREEATVARIAEAVGWSQERVKRVTDLYCIKVTAGPLQKSQDGGADLLTVPVPRWLKRRIMREAAVLNVPAGEVAGRILAAAFESGDLAPVDEWRAEVLFRFNQVSLRVS
jgi:hypothetical protein